jgi:hypothetical protein
MMHIFQASNHFYHMSTIKNLFPSFVVFFMVVLFSLTNCQKEQHDSPIVDDLPKKDTTKTIKDTTKVIDPNVKGHIVMIRAQEMGTNLPIPNRRVDLVTKNSTYYGTFYYLKDSLGRTDANGNLAWHWKGEELPENTYFSCSFDNAPKIQAGKTPAKNVICWSMVKGEVRLRIKVKLDSLQYPTATVVRFKFNYNGTVTWDDVWGFNPNKTKDTTVIVSDLGPATYSYGIRYNVNHATYSDYLYSGKKIEFPLSFAPRKTADKEIILQ